MNGGSRRFRGMGMGWILLLGMFILSSSTAQEVGLNDFRISTMGTDGDADIDALDPAVAYSSVSDMYVVVWESDDTLDNKKEIYAQRYTASTGVAIGSRVQISTTGVASDAARDGQDPAIAWDSNLNRFLVVWRGDPGILDENEVYGQIVDVSLSDVTGEFRISSVGTSGDTLRAASAPSVVYNSVNQEYLVVWSGDNQADGYSDIFGQRVSSAGAEIGADFQISSQATSLFIGAYTPDVTYNATNNEYLVVWDGDDAQDNSEVYGQRLNGSDVAALGNNDFRISDMGPDNNDTYGVDNPAVIWNSSDNEYLVVWSGDDNTAPLVESEVEIFGQRLSNAGAEIGADLRISVMGSDAEVNENTRDDYSAGYPDLSYNAVAGEYLVVWQGEADFQFLTAGEIEIFGQRITASTGTMNGPNLRLSDMGPDRSGSYEGTDPAVAAGPSGEWLIVFEGEDDSGMLVADEDEIYGQRYSSSALNNPPQATLISRVEFPDDVPNGGVVAELAALDADTSDSFTFSLVSGAGDTDNGSFTVSANQLLANTTFDESVKSSYSIRVQVYDGTAVAQTAFSLTVVKANETLVGDRFRISTISPDGIDNGFDHTEAAIAYNATADEFLIAWIGESDQGGMIENDYEIFVRRINAITQEPIDTPTRISDIRGIGNILGSITAVDVAWNSADNQYLVTWVADDTAIDNEYEVFGQRLSADGAEIGTSDFQISYMGDATTTYGADEVRVVYNATDNEYLVVFEGDHNVGSIATQQEIFARRVSAAGALQGSMIRVSNANADNDTTLDADMPNVAWNSTDNRYLVIWIDEIINGEDEIYGQLLNADGSDFGSDFRISYLGPDGNTSYDADVCSVAYNSTDNEFMVVWEGEDDTAPLVLDEMEIFGRRINAQTGALLGSQTRYSDMGPDGNTSYGAWDPQLAYGAAKNEYLVTWLGDNDEGTQVEGENEIFVQRINAATGAEVGSDERVSEMGTVGSISYDARYPNVAYDSDRYRFLVVWDSDDNTSPLIDGENEVYGQVWQFPAPKVTGISRSGANPTSASSISWGVSFSESVSGIDVSDFSLSTTGDSQGSISTVSAASGSSVVVTAINVSGAGTIGLSLVDDDSISSSDSGILLGGAGADNGSYIGQTYTIEVLVSAPSVTTDAAGSITTSGATLNGTVNDGGADTSITFDYGLTTSYGFSATAAQSPLTAGSGSTGVSASISSLDFASTYHYRVKAVNSEGTTNGSDRTFTTAATVPDPPTSASATAGNAQASVSFSAPASDGGSAITGYTVTSSPGSFTGTGATSPITVTGLINGTPYTFTVTATNAEGTSSASSASSAVTPAATVPNPPTSVSAVGGNEQAAVSFSAPASDGGSAITGYTVTSSPGGLTGTGATSPITVTGLTNGTAYTFTVTATNAVGMSSASSASSAVTPATVPDAPTSVSASGGNAQASVSFSAPASDGGSAILGYTVTSSPGGLAGTGFSSPIIVTGLTNGTPYTFTVTATNSVGASSASTASSAVTPATVPGSPTSVSATGGNAQASVSFSAPASDGGSAITGYTVTSSPGGITGIGATSPITVAGLTNGTAYTFTVTATNAVGTSSASSASSAVTPDIGGGIALATNALAFTATYGGSDPSAQAVGMNNVGVDGFSYSNSWDYSSGASGWLSVSPNSGSVSLGGSLDLTNSVSVSGINAGTYSATNLVVALDATNSPQHYVVNLTVGKASQSISFPAIGNKVSTDAVGLSATASSGLGLSFAVASGPASIVGGTNLTFSGSGSVSITASQAGDTNWLAAATKTNTFTVSKASQATLVFTPATPQTFNTTNSLSTTAGSGTGTVSYAVLSGQGAILSVTGLVATAGTGSIVVEATKASDAMYLSTSTSATVTVTKASQTINFSSPGDQFWTNAISLLASANSGLAVSFAVASGPASLAGSTNLTFSGYGVVVLTVDQSGDTDWAAAPTVTNTFNALGPQFIALGTNGAVVVSSNSVSLADGTDFGSVLMGSGSLTNMFCITNAGNATLTFSSVVANGAHASSFSAHAPGMTIAASTSMVVAVTFDPQSGGSNEASFVLSFDGTNSPYTVNVAGFGNGADIGLSTGQLSFAATYGGADPAVQMLTLTNAGVSGMNWTNTISYSSGATDWLTVTPVAGTLAIGEGTTLTSSSAVTGLGVGTYTATNMVMSAEATNSPQSFVVQLTIGKASQSITFPNPGQQVVTNVTPIAATDSSGLTVSLEVISGAATLSSSNSPATLSYTAPGMVTLRATQLGDANWAAAVAVDISFRAKADRAVPCDFDGDGMSDLSVYWPEGGNWYIRNSGGGSREQNWGWSETVPVPGDYDGDGLADIAVYWPADVTNNWYILQSSDGQLMSGGPVNWGWSAAVAAPSDYDGDGMMDLAVYWPEGGNWYIRYSGAGTHQQNWGWNETVPVPGDYDGDGLADIAVYWPADVTNNWYILQSSDSKMKSGGPIDWGWSAAVPVPGDYDGDGMTDIAVYWPEGGKWYIRYSSGGTREKNWGWSETVPVPGDYDGDGITDIAVYWPHDGIENWFILQSSDGQMKFGGPVDWGWSGAYPTQQSYWLHWF